MAEFVISFLIGFQVSNNGLDKTSNLTLDKKVGKKKKGYATGTKKGDGKNKKKKSLPTVLKPNFLQLFKTDRKSITISFQLTSEKFSSVTITVVYWGPIAKIYWKNSLIAVPCKINDDIAWVYFSTYYKMAYPNQANLEKLLAQGITFEFSYSKDKEVTRAQSDEPGLVYVMNRIKVSQAANSEILELEWPLIIPVKTMVVPNITLEDLLKATTKFYSTSPKKKDLLVLLRRRLHLNHTNRVNKVIFSFTPERIPSNGLLEGQSILKRTNKNKAKALKGLGSAMRHSKFKGAKEFTNGKKSYTTTASISGEKIFYEKPIWVISANNVGSGVLHASMFLTTTNILSKEMREIMNPLSLYIKDLVNVPIEELTLQGFHDMYMEVWLEPIFNGLVIPCPPLDEWRRKPNGKHELKIITTVFLNSLSTDDLCMLFQQKVILIKIFATQKKPVEDPHPPKVFGQGLKDDQTSFRNPAQPVHLPKEFTEALTTFDTTKWDVDTLTKLIGLRWSAKKERRSSFVHSKPFDESKSILPSQFKEKKFLLGISMIECCDILSRYWRVDYLVPIVSSKGFIDRYLMENCVLKSMNLEDLYWDGFNEEKAFWKSEDLIRRNCCIKYTLKLGSSLRLIPLRDFLTRPDIFNHAVAILHDKDIAQSLIKNVLDCNKSNIGDWTRIPPVPFREVLPPRDDAPTFLITQYEDIITGFAVDCGETVIVMVEALKNSSFAYIMNDIFKMPPAICQILFHSDAASTNRIYEEMLDYGGLYCVTLKQPLEDTMAQASFYLKGNVPTPAWRALILLDMISKSFSVEQVFLHHLLPTLNELMCLDIEFGCPIIPKIETSDEYELSSYLTL